MIRDRAFQQRTFEGKVIGTATIFLDDTRISTNVVNTDGSRAVGTRLSAPVYEQVMRQGRPWKGPAFVVNDRYITAYEPIRDPAGKVVGALYVGMLEAPFVQPQRAVFYVFLAAVIGTTLASLVLLFLVTKRMLRPIGRVVAMSRRVMGGDLSARVGIRPSGEMGLLCRAIDEMADAVAAREEQLKKATSRQIGQSEKLASIGRLAAGVAHEINNPLTGVLTFATLLQEKPNLDAQDREDLELIVRETTRVRDIVRGLLDFARESPHEKRLLHLNTVIRRTIRLLRNQKEFRHITIEEQLEDHVPWILGDENQVQQVLLNLVLNGCEAMPDGGTLTISTFALDGQLIVTVADTGQGISAENVTRIFEPFFTTKPAGKGTGLGLSVSYGILQQHNAFIDVKTEVGKGTTFTLMFPPAPPDALE
jgi:two-component system NtrC family sensor kinase